MKFIMLPYAGSIFCAYKEWKEFSNENLEIISLDYDGRGLRSGYAEPESWTQLIESTVLQIMQLVNDTDEYILFGHSMGAKVAIDVYDVLCQKRFKQPLHTIFSGTMVFSNQEKDLLNMSLKDFEDYFISKGGIPEEVLCDAELKEIVFEYLRKDVELLNGFKAKNKYSFNWLIPVILNGESEERSSIKEWQAIFGENVICKVFKGGHFFLMERKEEVYSFIYDMIGNIYGINGDIHSKVG